MKEKIEKTLKKVQKDTQKANSKSISSEDVPVSESLGKPDCPHCEGVGFLRSDVPVGHPDFGRLEPCVCRSGEVAQNARQRLYEMSNLDRLSHLNFENFNTSGNPKAESVSPQEIGSLESALHASEEFAKDLNGWLLLEGGYGCGKTHLAAAIANQVVQRIPTLFITVPDLLDSLRFAFSNPETTFELRFNDIRNAAFLVMDDFGTQNATPWAQEKLFQIINYRYINKLPTVITTNLILDEIESRIRSRLQDADFVKYLKISAPDYRRPKETSNPGLSMLSLSRFKEMTLRNFQPRDGEIGKEVVTTIVKERKYGSKNRFKDTEIIRDVVTAENIKALKDAHFAGVDFAGKPEGWLIFLGPSYSGKTHLAAAIGNSRLDSGGQVIMTGVSFLLDYLKKTFSPNTDVSFDRRFYEISNTPLLILDDLPESGANSIWAEEKLYQILSYRFNARLPTVITSRLTLDDFAINYPTIMNRILDKESSKVFVINIPPFGRDKKRDKK